MFEGNYSDLSPSWFKNVGTVIILTLLINAISSLEAIFFSCIRNLTRWRDRGYTNDYSKTQKNTLSEWIDFYTGPEF